MTPLTLLALNGVHACIGAYPVLHGVDLAVPTGQVTVLLGRNGAGKTTTLRTIMGLRRAAMGEIQFDDEPIGGPGRQLGTPEIAARGIGYLPEDRGLFDPLSVRENLLLGARGARTLADVDSARLDWLLGLFPALKTFWRRPAGRLSGGDRQMLAIARAMIEPRRLLLLDEPSKGLAPAGVQSLVAALRELKHARTTLLLVEHDFGLACTLGDNVALMDEGRIVHRGAMRALAEDPALQQRLLGFAPGPPR